MHWNQRGTWFQQVIGRRTRASLGSKSYKTISVWKYVVVVSNSCSKAVMFRFFESHEEFELSPVLEKSTEEEPEKEKKVRPKLSQVVVRWFSVIDNFLRTNCCFGWTC